MSVTLWLLTAHVELTEGTELQRDACTGSQLRSMWTGLGSADKWSGHPQKAAGPWASWRASLSPVPLPRPTWSPVLQRGRRWCAGAGPRSEESQSHLLWFSTRTLDLLLTSKEIITYFINPLGALSGCLKTAMTLSYSGACENNWSHCANKPLKYPC